MRKSMTRAMIVKSTTATQTRAYARGGLG